MAPRPIAVVLDGDPTPAWQQRALATIAGSPALDVVEVRLAGRPRRSLLRRAHAAAERHLLRLGADALAPVVVDRSLLGGTGELLGGAGERRSGPFEGGASAELVVWLADAPVSEDARDALYVRHGGRVEPAEQAVMRALLSDATCLETEVLLKRRGTTDGSNGSSKRGSKSDDGITVVIDRAVSGVRPFSLTLSRDMLLWKLAALVPRAVERALGADAPSVAASASATGPASASAPPSPSAPGSPSSLGSRSTLGSRSAPGSPSMFALLARSATAWPRVLLTRLLFRRPWAIRLRRRAPEPAAGWSTGGELVRWTRDHLYADPFLFEHEGRHHLFCEEQPPGAERAVIAHTELRLDGVAADPPTPVLARPYHLSYPFVFAHEGETFMIPETSAVARVELYRAVEFPHRWEHEAVLIDGLDAADATLLEHEDRLWLFASVTPEDASSLDELHLFWASGPRGPWQPHPRNPVVSDVRCARPAGAVQRWGSRLVRPGQDGSRRYGEAISFREIDLLSTSDYAEHEIARLEPTDLGGDARATHTYAADGRFEAIDLRRRELRGKSRMARLARAIRGIRTAGVGLLAACSIFAASAASCNDLSHGADVEPAGVCDKTVRPVAQTARRHRHRGVVRRLVDSLRSGQTGCLRGGVYVEDVTVSRSRIGLRAYPGEHARLVGRLWFPRTVHDDVFSYLTLDGRNTAELPSPSVNGNAIRFVGDEITNENTNICFVLGSSYGRAHGAVIERSRIHNCGHLPSRNTEHGIYVEDADRTRIVGNLIYDNADRGIQLYPNAQHTLIERNVIDGNGEGVSFSGDSGVASNNNLVQYNVISNSRIRANVESWYPRGNLVGVGNLVRDNCLFRGHQGTVISVAGGFTVASNVISDPLYADVAAGDFHVGQGSLCAPILEGRLPPSVAAARAQHP